jgi:serine/threonine protein kinase
MLRDGQTDIIPKLAYFLKALVESLSHLKNNLDITKEDCGYYPLFMDTLNVDNHVMKIRNLTKIDRRQFYATLKGEHEEQKVFVKCCEKTYGKEAHELLYQKGFAPRLLYMESVGLHRVIVIMEYLNDYKMVSEAINEPESVKKEIMDKMHQALEILHQDEFVHGDFRDNNIMYKIDGSVIQLKIVDFDFAGKCGEARYGPQMNMELNWHPDVKDYGLVEKSHDIHWKNVNASILKR